MIDAVVSMFVAPPDSHIKILIPNAMLLERRIFVGI